MHWHCHETLHPKRWIRKSSYLDWRTIRHIRRKCQINLFHHKNLQVFNFYLLWYIIEKSSGRSALFMITYRNKISTHKIRIRTLNVHLYLCVKFASDWHQHQKWNLYLYGPQRFICTIQYWTYLNFMFVFADKPVSTIEDFMPKFSLLFWKVFLYYRTECKDRI